MLLSKCRLSNNRLDNFLLSKQTLGNFYLDGPIFGSGGGLIDHSDPVQVVNANYDTSGNGGRKLVRLNSGNIYAAMRNGISAWYIYKSTDNGGTWSLFKTVTVSVNDIALATNGTNIYAIISYSTSGVKCYAYNESGTVLVNGVNVDASQSTMGLCSLAIDSSGNIHAAWASKNATYLDSFNVRYSKSLDGGVTWATPIQITNHNLSGVNNTIPCIVINGSGNPVILYLESSAGSYVVSAKIYNGSTWGGSMTVYAPGNYSQSDPCGAVDGNGHIHVVWRGLDVSPYSNSANIFYSKSTNNGSTWSEKTRLTLNDGTGYHQRSPSITVDKNNKIYVQWHGIDAGEYRIRQIVYDGYSWGSITNLAIGTNVSICNNYDNFTQPLNIFNGGADVKFSGVFYV